MTEQLALDLAPATAPETENPNAYFFTPSGEPRRLMWCSDSARLTGICSYIEDKARFRPHGGCCLDLEGRGRGIPY